MSENNAALNNASSKVMKQRDMKTVAKKQMVLKVIYSFVIFC